MDNFEVKVVSEGKESFIKALEICMKGHTATHYQITKERGLELYWTLPQAGQDPTVLPLPYPMKGGVITDFAWNWYTHADFKEFAGKEPDHDGSNGRGFSITNDRREWYLLARICHEWSLYGK